MLRSGSVLAALCMTMAAPAASASGPVITVACTGIDGPTQSRICELLQSSMESTWPGANVVPASDHGSPAALELQFTLLRKEVDFAIGQLAWRSSGGRSHTGPAVEIAVMDSTLRDTSLKQFVTTLIESAEIPDMP